MARPGREPSGPAEPAVEVGAGPTPPAAAASGPARGRRWWPSRAAGDARGDGDGSDGVDPAAGEPTPLHLTRRGRVVLAYGSAGLLYLALSVTLWWHVWTGGASTTATCGCGDPALFLWFLEWPAYALAHGDNLFFSTMLFHPGGIDLLSQTSVLAIGVPLAPVTWLFGPVATLNVASTLSPVLSALGGFWLLRRWVRWTPAAFCGGGLFGFSPFVIQTLAYAHLMTASLVCLPLVLGCLDELLVRQRRRPARVGLALGALLVVEFFVSTEMLVIIVLSTLVSFVLLVGYRLVSDREDLVARVRHALRGLVPAGAVAVAVLAYPMWDALAGPAHLSGRIWPNIPVIGGYELRTFVQVHGATKPSLLLDIGGYLGRPLPTTSYMGWWLLGVLAAGLVAFRRDRRLWFFSSLALVTAVLSLGERKHAWVPWQLFDRMPVLDNVVEQRFIAVTFLAVAAWLAVIVDDVRGFVLPETSWGSHWTARAQRSLPLAGALVVLAAAFVPLVVTFAPDLPYATRTVEVPPWFREVAPTLPPGRVVLAYPAPFSGIQSAMAWQAVEGLPFAQAGGGGPQGTPWRAGAERPGFLVIQHLDFGFTQPPSGTPSQLAAVRAALRGWEVTTVVIPDQAGETVLFRGHDPVYATAFMTAALGQVPVYQDTAWVWEDAAHPKPALGIGTQTLAECTAEVEHEREPPLAVARCVVAAARAHQAALDHRARGARTPTSGAPGGPG